MKKDKRPFNLLIIEDNPGDLLLVRDYVDDMILSASIIEANSLKEAKDVLSQSDLNLDAILLDLTLPDMEGEELINAMRASSGKTPIIILTGYVDVNFAIKSLSLGISDYLVKDELNPTILYKSLIYSIERNKSLINLRESEQRYSDLFHLSPQPLWVTDLESHQIKDVNDAAIQHYGYTHYEFLNMNIFDLCHPDDNAQLSESLKTRDIENETSFQIELRHRKKNDETIHVEMHSNIMTYMGRSSEIVLTNDISDHKQHVSAIQQQNNKLKEIAWIQSHVVRAPLTRMMGIVDLLKDETVEEAEKDKFLKHLIDSSNELDEIIKDIVQKTHSIDLSTDKTLTDEPKHINHRR